MLGNKEFVLDVGCDTGGFALLLAGKGGGGEPVIAKAMKKNPQVFFE